MDFDELLKGQHEDAAKDFEEGDESAGKHEDKDMYEELKNFHQTVKELKDHIMGSSKEPDQVSEAAEPPAKETTEGDK